MRKKKPLVLDSARGYDLAAPTYDTKEKYLNSFDKGRVVALLGDVKGKALLDVGAGTGRISVIMAQKGAQVTGVDVSPEIVKVLARKNRHITALVAEAESLPFPDASFEVVTAAFLIVHLKDPTRFFDEAYRVLKDDGLLLITNVNQKDPPIIETKAGPIVIESYYHRPERVRTILEELAFTIVADEFINEGGVWINQIILARK